MALRLTAALLATVLATVAMAETAGARAKNVRLKRFADCGALTRYARGHLKRELSPSAGWARGAPSRGAPDPA
ncbi:MAG TPA: hypothetical protein VJT75_02825, partial [Thermoleophilaceae bacterium]|nr:hypothetical protein [Thermoleophilaceae bacterium]